MYRTCTPLYPPTISKVQTPHNLSRTFNCCEEQMSAGWQQSAENYTTIYKVSFTLLSIKKIKNKIKIKSFSGNRKR